MAKTKVSIVKGPEHPDEKQVDINVRKAIEMAGGLADIGLPPKKESSYNVSKTGQQRGNKWSERASLRKRLSTS